jgi:hypothetical protein
MMATKSRKIDNVMIHGVSANFGSLYTSLNAQKTMTDITKSKWDISEEIMPCAIYTYANGLRSDLGSTTTIHLNVNHELSNMLMTRIKVTVVAPGIYYGPSPSSLSSTSTLKSNIRTAAVTNYNNNNNNHSNFNKNNDDECEIDNENEWASRINGFGSHMIVKSKLGPLPWTYSECTNIERDIQGVSHLYDELEGVFPLDTDQVLDLQSVNEIEYTYDLEMPYKYFPICLFKNYPLKLAWNPISKLFKSSDSSTPHNVRGQVFQKTDLEVRVEIHGVRITETSLRHLKIQCDQNKGNDYKALIRVPIARQWYHSLDATIMREARMGRSARGDGEINSIEQQIQDVHSNVNGINTIYSSSDGTEKTTITHLGANTVMTEHSYTSPSLSLSIQQQHQKQPFIIAPDEAYIRLIKISVTCPTRGFYVTFQMQEHMDENEHGRYDDGTEEKDDCLEEFGLVINSTVQTMYKAKRGRNDNFFDFMSIKSKPKGKVYFIPYCMDVYGYNTKGIMDFTNTKELHIKIKMKPCIEKGTITIWALYDDIINISNVKGEIPFGMINKGMWQMATQYLKFDVVVHNNLMYCAKAMSVGHAPHPDKNVHWSLMSSSDYIARSCYVGDDICQ